ncbi:MAG: Holliday junction branch migration protein RuvA [Nitrospirales bacterium]|nr:Holliday junction branch migration protein RuvA [Nitrospirales bacterium]
MIANLTGRLSSKAPSQVILDVHGVGYDILIPLSTYFALPNLDDTVGLHIHTHFRDNAIQLFGFFTEPEKSAFGLLTGVSGIGGKLALNVLSTLPIADLLLALQTDNAEKLATVPGVGKKSAGRMILELKDKLETIQTVLPVSTALPVPSPSSQLETDAVSALINLGYRPQEVKQTVKACAAKYQGSLSLGDLIREALKGLAQS